MEGIKYNLIIEVFIYNNLYVDINFVQVAIRNNLKKFLFLIFPELSKLYRF